MNTFGFEFSFFKVHAVLTIGSGGSKLDFLLELKKVWEVQSSEGLKFGQFGFNSPLPKHVL